MLGISIFTDIIFSNSLKRGHHAQGEYSTWNDLLEGKINSEILIYGSSRAWVQFSPKIISNELRRSCYNLGIDGHSFWLQNLRHKKILKLNTRPKYIIYSVDYNTLRNSGFYNSDQFLPYMLFDKDIKDYTSSLGVYSIFDYYIPLIRYRGKIDAIKQALKNMIIEPNRELRRQRGYKGIVREWGDDLENAKKKFSSYSIEMYKPYVKLFDEFLQECENQDIKVILVYAPEYIEGQKFIDNRVKFVKLFEFYATKYNIPFFDYSKDEVSYDKKYFYNSTHLNKKGAELFSEKLSFDLIKTNSDHGIYMGEVD